MKVGILQHLLHVPEAELFSTAKQLGFDGVELSFGAYASSDHPLWKPQGAAELRQRAAAAGVAVPSVSAGYFNRYGFVDPGLKARQRHGEVLGQLIDACAAAAVPILHVPFYGANEIKHSAAERLALEVLRPLAQKAADQQVILGFDTLLPVEDLERLLDRLASPAAKVYYDVANARAAGRDVIAEIKLLGPRICQFHVKDRERREPFSSVPLGQGATELKPVLTALAGIGYDRWLVLDTPSNEDAEQSARQNLQFLRSLVA